MLEVNADDLLKDLEKYLAETTRKLENMVRGFAYEVTLTAASNTPFGDVEQYAELYQQRVSNPGWQSYGLEPAAGFAQGSWQVAFSGVPEIQEFYGFGSDDAAASKVKQTMINYKIGDTFAVTNIGPYIVNLEAGYSDKAPNGIMQPTLKAIEASYKVDLQRYFKQG